MTNEEAIKILEKMKAYMMFPLSPLLEGKSKDEEAVDIAIEALEKQIPTKTVKPDSPYFRYACPSCGNYPISGHYCNECGQAILYDKEGEG